MLFIYFYGIKSLHSHHIIDPLNRYFQIEKIFVVEIITFTSMILFLGYIIFKVVKERIS